MEQMEIKSAEERRELRERIEPHLLMTSEVEEILNVSRARLTQLTKEGKLVPLKYGTYLKEDVYAYKEAFDHARNNNMWLKEFE